LVKQNTQQMGFKTIKIGDSCIIKDTGDTGIVEDIVSGKYKITGIDSPLFAHEIKTIAKKPDPKPPTPIKKRSKIDSAPLLLKQNVSKGINKVSDKQKKYNSIYTIVAPKFKINNPECLARLPGCTVLTEEIHHTYKRTGIWLIMSEYFLPVCRCCHRTITDDSAMAIETGLSISRMVELPHIFTDEEQLLMDKIFKKD
jgi:hypothetical protein